MGSAMQSLYSANPTKPPQNPQTQRLQWGQPSSGSQQQQPTFSSMQQSGQPRPAPPPSWYGYKPGTTPGWGQPAQSSQAPTTSTQQPQAPQSWTPPQQPQGGFRSTPPAGMPSYYGAPPYSGPSPQAPQGPQTPTAQAPASPFNNPVMMGSSSGYNTDQGYAPPPMPYSPPGQPASGYQPPQAPQGMTATSGQPTQYGSGYAATPQQQNTANQLGNATQSLLLNQLQNPNSTIGSPAAQNLLQQQLANPNPLGSQAYQTQAQQAQTQLNEQYQQQQDAINSNLASRGVYDSSLAGGYLSDLNTAQGRQMASIQANLLPQEAQLQLQGTNSALGNAQAYSGQNASNISSALANSLGYGNQQFGQSATTAQINLAQQLQQQQQLNNMLSLTSY